MALPDIFSDSFFPVIATYAGNATWEKCPMYLLGGVPTGPADNDLITLFIPFQDGAWPHTELLSNISRYGDLTLSRQLRFSYRHTVTLPW
jgi:hypothetical protein